MRKYRQVVEFANFICHFDEKVLLDFLHEIVLPAFLTGKRVRMYGASKYLLLDVKLVNIEPEVGKEAVPALVGRFVLDTELRRDQILVDGKIVSSAERLPSAPSSLFVLILESHKLIYAKQVSGAPGISAFRTTIEFLLKHRRAEYVNEIYLRAKEENELDPSKPKVTKRSIRESIPVPSLEIVPLGGANNLEVFVKQFKLLKEVSIKVVRPNAEINNNGLFNAVEAAREQVDANATSLTHRNAEGLNKVQSIKQLAPALEGNAIITLKGTGDDNASISGSNDEMSIKEPVDIPPGINMGSRVMYYTFRRLLKSGVLKISRVLISENNRKKLRGLKIDVR